MKYRLIKGMLSKRDISMYNRENEDIGLRVTGDILEVDYTDGDCPGLCVRRPVYVGGDTTPALYVRDLGEFYEVRTPTRLLTVSKKDVEIIERAPL